MLWPRIPFSPFFFLDYATPWVWLALLPIEDGRPAPADFPRMLAVTSALLLTLWAYPVPGTQTWLATFLVVVPAAISAGDVVAAARAFSPRLLDRAVPRAMALLTVLLAVGGQTRRLVSFATESYDASVPVGLPGISRLRLDADVVTVLTALVRELRDAPDTFLCTDGCYSLYFWTGKEPPTRTLLTHTIDLFSPRQQDAIAEALLSRPQARLVLSPSFPQFQKSFYQKLFRFFREEKRIGPFLIMKRADVPVPPGFH